MLLILIKLQCHDCVRSPSTKPKVHFNSKFTTIQYIHTKYKNGSIDDYRK